MSTEKQAGDPDALLNALVITKGHPFEREPFFQVFD